MTGTTEREPVLKQSNTSCNFYIQMNPTKIYTTLARYADNSIQWLQVLSRVSHALAAESPEQASQPAAPETQTPEPEKPKTGRGRPRKLDQVPTVTEPEVIVTKEDETAGIEIQGETVETTAARSEHTVDSLKLLIKPLTSANADVRMELKETLLKHGESLSTMDPAQYPAFVTAIEALLKKHNL